MIWITLWYLLASLITFATYAWDKRKARLSEWRVKERTLHVMELLGGWPGGFVAQRVFHHKRKKTKFIIVFWAIVTLHIGTWAAVIYLKFYR